MATDSGSSSSDFITNDTSLTVSGTNGTLASGEKIQVSSDGGTTWADVTQSTSTSWSYVDPATHATSFTYQTRIVDTAGNIGTTASQAITIDTIAPTVAINSSGGPTSQATHNISGTVTSTEAALGATVTVYDNGTQIGTATVGTDGAWSTSITLTGNGNHSIVAKDTDAAGNTGSSAPIIFNLTITPNGWGNPAGGVWNNAANWSSGSVPTTASNVVFGSIGATAPYVTTILSTTTVTVNSVTLNDPEVTLLDEGVLAIVGSLVEMLGSIVVENNGSLSIGGGSSLLIDFSGSGGNMILGSSSGFTGTITAISNATGEAAITGAGTVTTISGDAVDFQSSGGTPASLAGMNVALTGAITGAASGVSAIQTGYGAVSVSTTSTVIGDSGFGILAEDLNSLDTSDVTVLANGNVSGGTIGIDALTNGSGNVSVATGASVSVNAQASAIQAVSSGVGNVSVTTATGDVIMSDSDGILAINQATAIPLADDSAITVTAYGTISSGAILNRSGTQPAGVLAGYKGGANNTVNQNVFGSVTIYNYANITASGGDGIRAFNYGIGDLSVIDEPNTTIIAPGEFGIRESNYGPTNESVTTSSTDTIVSGSSGINVVNLATLIASASHSAIAVMANGTIKSGAVLNPSGSQPSGVNAGYFGANGTINNAINGTVSVDNFADIAAAAGWGIDAYNWGNGSVSLTDEAGTSVAGAQYGIGAYSLGTGSGGVNVNILGGATVATNARYGLAGIQASSNNGSNISITMSTGDVVNSAGNGIASNVSATSVLATGQISITAVGTINSGFNNGGSGIVAGYNNNGSNTVNATIAGSVAIDSFATISAAAGSGISIYNWGVGDVTVTLESSSAITSKFNGVTANAQGGGNVSVSNSGAIASVFGNGIYAQTGNNVANSVGNQLSVTNSGSVSNWYTPYATVQLNNGSTKIATLANTGTITSNLPGLGLAIYDSIGAVSINNSGSITGAVNMTTPATTSTFNNQVGGTWSFTRYSGFSGSIVNSGTINMFGASYLATGGTLAITNSGIVNIADAGAAFIGAPVSGTGTFKIGDSTDYEPASLEFLSSVGAGQTVSFGGHSGLLTLDSPSTFGGSISGLAAGDIIFLSGTAISGANLSGSSLTVAQNSAPSLTFSVSGALTLNTFSVLSGNAIVLVPNSGTLLTGALGAQSFAPASSQFYQLSGAAISSNTGAALNIGSSDNNTSDSMLIEINQASSLMVSGNSPGVIVATAGANIDIISAGSISTSGGTGLSTNSVSGSTTIVDYGYISGAVAGIQTRTSGAAPTSILLSHGGAVNALSATATANAATATTSATLNFVSTPSWVVPGMNVYDVTISQNIGTVASTTGTTVTLSANAARAVASGDFLSFPATASTNGATSTTSNTLTFASTPSWVVSGMGVYDNTTGKNIGTVSAVTGTTVALSGNAANAVASGDTLSFVSLGVYALTSIGDADVTMLSGSVIDANGVGILVQSNASSIPSGDHSSLLVSAAGYILSGSGGTAAIRVGYLGGAIATPNANVFGSVSVDNSGTIDAIDGMGINAFDYGTGNILVANEGTISAPQYGIQAYNYGTGNVTVVGGNGSTINSGSTGILAFNQATTIGPLAPATIAVVSLGTITTGSALQPNGNVPAGINAGFGTGTYNPNIYGDVVVFASSITTGIGIGINAYDYGIGDITINIASNATISALNSAPVTSGGAPIGINVSNYGAGNIEVSTSSGDVIKSGSTGINASSSAAVVPVSADAHIAVNASGTINVGNVVNNSANTPSGISAGFYHNGATSSGVNGSVVVNSAAVITVAGGRGLNAYNYGNGDVTVNDSGNVTVNGSTVRANSTTTTTSEATEYGIQASALGAESGDVAINIASGVTISATSASTNPPNGVYAVYAYSNTSGNISVITNSGSNINTYDSTGTGRSGGVGIDAVNEASPIFVATATAATSGATSTTSRTLNFVSTPSWVTNGSSVFDITTGKSIGVVSSTAATTITLLANAASAVASGDSLSFAELVTTSAATATSSNTLSFGATPSWIVAGMTVYDVTTGIRIGTVASTTGTSVTLTANAAHAVGSGDALSFPEIATASAATSTTSSTLNFALTPSWIATGMTAYDDTTRQIVGTVSALSGNTVTLTSNAASAVSAGDVLSFTSSSIVVTSYSSIHSGTLLTGTGAPPAGIIAGYLGGNAIPTSVPLAGVNGDVTVNNFGSITADAGDGIRAFTYGIGNVTVNDGAGTITALGGTTPTPGYDDGIDARNWGPGDLLVTTSAGTVINSGASGISALNFAPSNGGSFAVPSSSQVTVIAYGTITSGTIPTLSNSVVNQPSAGILAGYDPGVSLTNPVDAVNGNVAGNVLIDDYASIAAAAGTDGIRGVNYGTGGVTIEAQSSAVVAGGRYGIAGFAFDGGDVSITNYATVTGSTAAIDAQATGGGTVFIDNFGTLNGAVSSNTTAGTTVHNELGAIWLDNANGGITGPSQLINDGTITLDGSAVSVGGLLDTGTILLTNGGSLEVGSAGSAAAGSFTIDTGGVATLSGTITADSIVDNGLMLISANGISNLVGTLGGTGHIDIGSGASLIINSVAAIAPTISFHGSGTLVLSGTDLDSSLTFSPVISLLDATDQIDFSGTVTAAYWNAGILTLENGSTPVGYLHLSGNYASETFTVTMNGGVSQIVDPPGAVQSIADGAVLELNGPTVDNVVFESGKGVLVLDHPASFQGQIVGLAGDIVTLRGFDANHTTIHALYNAINDTTQLSVADSSDHHSASLILDGNYSSMLMSAAADQGGGVDIEIAPRSAAIVSGETLELNQASSQMVEFSSGSGSLILDQPSNFTGEIIGFTGTAPDVMHSDVIDLQGIDHDSAGFNESYVASSGELTLSDGMHNASLTFQNFKGVFSFASDGHGGTLIMDPPATTTQAEVSSIGGNSQFVFKDFVATAALASMDDWGHGDAGVSNKLPVLNAGDAGPEPWLFLHAIATTSELPGSSILDYRSHHFDSLNPKDFLSANLVANEFILPQH
ncbi:Ig-like domain-containing protein [Frankia sp. RB7]|nr:Ig-like domain-containing protein [Frankia sp. RB7]